MLPVVMAEASGEVCRSPTGTFTAYVDPHANSKAGALKFVECGDIAHPTLGLELFVEYTFEQYDASNHHHPLSFAYSDEGDLLGPSKTSATNKECAKDLACQTPLYFLNDNYLGDNDHDFGIESYESEFELPRATWIDNGDYDVRLMLDEDVDLVYLSRTDAVGRVTIVSGDRPLNLTKSPQREISQEIHSNLDHECGTTGLDDEVSCALCGNQTTTLAKCLNAVDCSIRPTRSSFDVGENPAVSFAHQVIPHHLAAINMAKVLLKHSGEALPEDVVGVAWDMINIQTIFIDTMQSYLKAGGYEFDALRCEDDDGVDAALRSLQPTGSTTIFGGAHSGGGSAEKTMLDS